MRVKAMLLIVGTMILASGVAAVGQDDPIAARKALMKANNPPARAAFGMASGRAPFDAAEAKKAMETIISDMATFVTLFPEGSDVGDTSASPDIWTNMDDFKAHAAKLVSDATAASAAADNGIDAFKEAIGAVGQDCQACHDKYRKD